MKEFIRSELTRLGYQVKDFGALTFDPNDDYPIFSARVAAAVSKGEFERGISVCGSGIGASIAANRFRHVRAALCITAEMAELSRRHNDANMLVIGGRITTRETVTAILNAWLTTAFEAGRHSRRRDMLDDLKP